MHTSTTTKNILPLITDGFTVGFSRFSLVDTRRKLSKGKSDNRKMEVLVWYPGESTSGMRRKSYLENHRPEKLLLSNIRLGFRHVRALSKITTNSYVDIAVSSARDRFPVLLFSHDLASLPEYYTILMESLAAEGYFVFSINHPKVAEETILADASMNNHATFDYTMLPEWFGALWSLRKFRKAANQQEKWKLSRVIASKWTSLANAHAEMMKDKVLLLDFLEHVNTNVLYKIRPYDIFSRKIDLKNIGVLGHGWGGSSAVHSLVQDKRIGLAVNIDGFQFCNSLNDTIARPLLMIYSEKNSGINDGSYFCSSDYETATIQSTGHNSFNDIAYLTSHQSSNNQNLMALVRTIDEVKSFFNRRLKNKQFSSFPKTPAYQETVQL